MAKLSPIGCRLKGSEWGVARYLVGVGGEVDFGFGAAAECAVAPADFDDPFYGVVVVFVVGYVGCPAYFWLAAR